MTARKPLWEVTVTEEELFRTPPEVLDRLERLALTSPVEVLQDRVRLTRTFRGWRHDPLHELVLAIANGGPYPRDVFTLPPEEVTSCPDGFGSAGTGTAGPASAPGTATGNCTASDMASCTCVSTHIAGIDQPITVSSDPLCSVHGDHAQPEPTPRPGATSMHELVQQDLQRRLEFGLAKYGTPLTAHNGRNALRDAYEEVLDHAVYLRQAMAERADLEALVSEHVPAGRLYLIPGRKPDESVTAWLMRAVEVAVPVDAEVPGV